MQFNRTLNLLLAVLLMAFFIGCMDDQPTSPVQQKVSKQEVGLNKVAPDLKKATSSGTNNGYFWQNYTEGGSSSMTFGSGGNFAVSWNNCNDIVAGKGWNPSGARNVGYNCGALSGSYKFFGVYGWTTNPLIEYYVAERGSASGGTNVGSVSSDGHTYSLWKQQRVNAPSIQGTQTFWQFKSSWGGSGSGNHTVTLNNHWNAWKSKMGSMGSGNLLIIAVENWGGGSGYCNATVW
jgi:Glycosyl hydrolases family 11.